MTPERIDEIIKSYRFDKGRCGHILMEMQTIEKQITAEKNFIAIDLAAPHAQQITDMPRGTGISNPTEKHGIMLADGYKSPELIALENKLNALQSEYDKCIENTSYVEVWFSGLSERERWVVESQVVDGLSWKSTVADYISKFGDDTSKDTLKRIKDKAMKRIYQMAE